MNKEKLYEAFGELIYAIAMADGVIQKEETEALEAILKDHPWSADIKWSFDYEVKNKKDVEDTYKKALYTCTEYGPAKEYDFLLEILEKIGAASDGFDSREADVIYDFQYDLKQRFVEELKENNLINRD